jgi:hypothetical protein
MGKVNGWGEDKKQELRPHRKEEADKSSGKDGES